jgi:DNA polymerase-3 subunit delta'
MQFKDIFGQEVLKKRLIQSVQDNRVSHAQLFLGLTGSGSLALAVAYAQYLNCEDKRADDSCGICASCRKYIKLIHPDLHFSYPFFAKRKEETAANYMEQWRSIFLKNPYLNLDSWRHHLGEDNKQANINIAECHQIIKKLSLKSYEGTYKVLIMWLPEYLDKQGNALLKLIEEPPANTLFLLVAENQDQILTTILSRTQLIKVNRLKEQEIVQYLLTIKGLNEIKAKQIAYISDGNIQKAQNLIVEEENNPLELLKKWMNVCVMDKGLDIIEFVENSLTKLGREGQKSFLFYAINMMRESLLLKENLTELVFLPEIEQDFAERFSKRYGYEQIEAVVAEFEKASYHIERNANPKILFLDVSLQIVLFLKYQTLPKGTQYI